MLDKVVFEYDKMNTDITQLKIFDRKTNFLLFTKNFDKLVFGYFATGLKFLNALLSKNKYKELRKNLKGKSMQNSVSVEANVGFHSFIINQFRFQNSHDLLYGTSEEYNNLSA